LVAVALGAFAAHGLKARLSVELLATFETGVRYQMYHALALLAVGWACTRWPGGALSLSGVRWLGAITPLGGVAFLAGWLCLAWAAWKA